MIKNFAKSIFNFIRKNSSLKEKILEKLEIDGEIFDEETAKLK